MLDVIKSEKPSGTYVLVRLIRPVKFRPDEPARPVGDEVVVSEDLANHLASNALAAILYRTERNIWVPT